ncbi:MAG TPA: hypothetical protein DEF18_06805 [Muricauda sp.]|nr:hypothetical protein [Allomuricauda sp.]|tara:strand:- start:5407 stop:5604 length:198 start_codon:yes stop_codon:yes gene_type:complete
MFFILIYFVLIIVYVLRKKLGTSLAPGFTWGDLNVKIIEANSYKSSYSEENVLRIFPLFVEKLNF